MQLLFSALTTQSANIAEEGRSLAAVMIRRVITAEFSEFFPKLTAEQLRKAAYAPAWLTMMLCPRIQR